MYLRIKQACLATLLYFGETVSASHLNLPVEIHSRPKGIYITRSRYIVFTEEKPDISFQNDRGLY
jgi:hypothetical protein